MAEFQSFETSKQKILKIWERNEKNTSEIENNLNKFSLNFSTVNFIKNIKEISLVEKKVYNISTDLLLTFPLNNFPDWIINHLQVVLIVSSEEGYNLDNFVLDPFVANTAGTLKTGDIILTQDFYYWFAKLENTNYRLKIYNNINLRQVTVSPSGFSSTQIPTFIELFLKIQNPRIYENINEKKQ